MQKDAVSRDAVPAAFESAVRSLSDRTDRGAPSAWLSQVAVVIGVALVALAPWLWLRLLLAASTCAAVYLLQRASRRIADGATLRSDDVASLWAIAAHLRPSADTRPGDPGADDRPDPGPRALPTDSPPHGSDSADTMEPAVIEVLQWVAGLSHERAGAELPVLQQRVTSVLAQRNYRLVPFAPQRESLFESLSGAPPVAGMSELRPAIVRGDLIIARGLLDDGGTSRG